MARYTYQGVVTPPAPTIQTVSNAGDITNAIGTYYFWLQTRNRAGFSGVSTVVTTSIVSGDRVDFTIPSSVRPTNDGQYVHSAYILASKTNNPALATIVCSVPLYQLDEVTPRSLPITIQVGADHQLEAGKQVDYYSQLPTNPCSGQRVYVEQDDRVSPAVDFNTIVEYQPFAATPGWYPAFDQTFSPYISDVTQQGGALVSVNAATSVITTLYALNTSIENRSPSVPIGFWIINDGTQPVPAGSRIGMSLFIGEDNVSSDFSGRFLSIFRGYVNVTTGVNSVSDGNGGTMLLVNEPVSFASETVEILKLQRSLPVGYAVWIDVECIATYEELNNRAPFGAKIKVSPFFFTFGSTPIAPTPMGGAIADVQGSRLVVPGADLSVTVLAGSGNVQFNNLGTAFSFWNREAQNIILAPNTADQPIAITKEGLCFALDDLTGTTQLRALVSTVDGVGQVSSWSDPIALDGTQNLSISIAHPSIVRIDYPDLIAGRSDGVFDCYTFRVYVKKTGGDTYYWDIPKGATDTTTGTIATTTGTLGDPATPPNTYGLHRVTSFSETPASGVTTLAAGSYTIAIAPVYLNNVSAINNSPDGGIKTLSSTYAEALDDSSYWRAVIGDPLLLRSYDRTLRPGMRIAISNSTDWYYWDSESTLSDDAEATIAVNGVTIGRFRLGTDGLGAFGLLYRFSSSIVSPPDGGQIRLNNADLSLVTTIYASESDRNGVVIAPILNSLKPGASLLLTSESDTSSWALYQLGAQTDSGAYSTLAVTYLGHHGALSGRIRVTFANRGVDGSPGTPGAASNLTIGTVTTLSPGLSATATISGTAPNFSLNLGLPKGDTGTAGAAGATGATGLGWTGGSYNPSTGTVTFTSNDGLGFATGDLRGATGSAGATGATGSVSSAASLKLIQQSSTPADPGAGNTAIYSKTSDGKLYYLPTGGTEQVVGSGGSANPVTANSIVNSGTSYTTTGTPDIVPLTLTGNCTITLPTPPATANTVYSIEYWLYQDATGGRSVTWAATSGLTIAWDASSSAPAINTSVNKLTIVFFSIRNGDTQWRGQISWMEA